MTKSHLKYQQYREHCNKARVEPKTYEQWLKDERFMTRVRFEADKAARKQEIVVPEGE
jgi:hypothetical protein